MARRLFGGPHHQIGLALSELGTVHFRQGDFARAAELQAESASVFEQVYGSEHAAVAIARGNLAEAWYELGELDRAKVDRRRALAQICAIFGEDSSRCAGQHAGMGRIELGLSRIESAELHFREALVGYRHTLGDEHPDVAVTQAWLAESLRRQRRFEDAMGEMTAAATRIPTGVPGRQYHFMIIVELRARLTCQIGQPAECRERVLVADAALAERYAGDHPRRRELARLVSGP